jgi:hypothetical protein
MSPIATFMSGSRARRGVAWLAPVVVALCWPSHADAARPTLVVLPASGHGVSARIIERARQLFVESLGRRDRFHVTDYDRPPTAERPGTEEAVMTARFTGATLAVALDLSHEGADTVFDVHCWDAVSGQDRCHVREKTAAGPDLLPDFTEWLAMRLVRELDASPEYGAPNEPQFITSRRREPRTFTFGARASVMVPVDSPARSAAPLGGFGVLMAADVATMLVALGFDHHSGSDDHRSWGVGLELDLPLADAERLPYLGLGAWYVAQHLGGQGASGLQLRPTLGIIWGRHDVARLRTEATYFVDLFEEHEQDRLIPGSGQGHVSHGVMISLGVTF